MLDQQTTFLRSEEAMFVQHITNSQKNSMLDLTIGELLDDYPDGFSYLSNMHNHSYDAVVEPAGTYRANIVVTDRGHGICYSHRTDRGVKFSQLNNDVEDIMDNIDDA